MINKNIQLKEDLFNAATLTQLPTRQGYGEGLVLAGEKDLQVVALCADLTESTQMLAFKKKFPDRFVEIGIGEQNMASVAAGMAAMGKIPFFSSYAMFSPGRNWEQIRTTICYNDQNAKIVGSHAGVSVGPDGATHQAIEDIAITRALPRMTVLVPCDVNEARRATLAAATMKGPVYLRLQREKTPVLTSENTPFEIGKGQILFDSEKKPDVCIIGCGPLLHNALLAAKELEENGVAVRVINMATVKPLDESLIISSAKDAGCIVSVEEHQIAGGLGAAVAELLAKNNPVAQEFIGVHDRFGESGQPSELLEHFGMNPKHIVEAAKKAISRKAKA